MSALPDSVASSAWLISPPRLDRENRRCHLSRHVSSGDQLPCGRQNVSSSLRFVELCLTLIMPALSYWTSSLCNSVISVYLWLIFLIIVNHRGTEDTEVTQQEHVKVLLQLTMANGPCVQPRHHAKLRLALFVGV